MVLATQDLRSRPSPTPSGLAAWIAPPRGWTGSRETRILLQAKQTVFDLYSQPSWKGGAIITTKGSVVQVGYCGVVALGGRGLSVVLERVCWE